MKEREIEYEAKKKLEADGWVYWFPVRTWGEHDIMSVFDFVAAKGRRVIFVQLTSLQHIADRHKKILEFYRLNKVGPFANVFVWGYDKVKQKFKIRKI